MTAAFFLLMKKSSGVRLEPALLQTFGAHNKGKVTLTNNDNEDLEVAFTSKCGEDDDICGKHPSHTMVGAMFDALGAENEVFIGGEPRYYLRRGEKYSCVKRLTKRGILDLYLDRVVYYCYFKIQKDGSFGPWNVVLDSLEKEKADSATAQTSREEDSTRYKRLETTHQVRYVGQEKRSSRER